jgi:hypothetical protein
MLAPLYPLLDHPLLSEQYIQLPSADEKSAQAMLAEDLLGLVPPAYTDERIVATLTTALALQVNFQLSQGIDVFKLKSLSTTHPGNTTQNRDRYIHPEAWRLVSQVTGAVVLGFSPPGIGV